MEAKKEKEKGEKEEGVSLVMSSKSAKKRRKIKSELGKEQVKRVMREFFAGKLRDSHGNKVTSIEQAKAIAMSEARAAEASGVVKRTFLGRKRIRPRKKNKKKRGFLW